jgi:hypothetical protein
MINWNDIGHAGELIVSTDLILNNFTPFTSQLPSSAVDIISLKNNRTYRIQVKTAEFNDSGYLLINNLHKYKEKELDIIATVDIKSKNIAYIPWTNLFGKSKVRLYNIKKDGFLYFYDYLKFPE